MEGPIPLATSSDSMVKEETGKENLLPRHKMSLERGWVGMEGSRHIWVQFCSQRQLAFMFSLETSV